MKVSHKIRGRGKNRGPESDWQHVEDICRDSLPSSLGSPHEQRHSSQSWSKALEPTPRVSLLIAVPVRTRTQISITARAKVQKLCNYKFCSRPSFVKRTSFPIYNRSTVNWCTACRHAKDFEILFHLEFHENAKSVNKNIYSSTILCTNCWHAQKATTRVQCQLRFFADEFPPVQTATDKVWGKEQDSEMTHRDASLPLFTADQQWLSLVCDLNAIVPPVENKRLVRQVLHKKEAAE